MVIIMPAAPELLTYIHTQRAAGFADEQIRTNLLANGWNDAAAREAFAELPPAPGGQGVANSGLSQPTLQTATGTEVLAGGELVGITELITSSWQAYREKLQTILLIQLVPLVATIVFGFLAVMSSNGFDMSGSAQVTPESMIGMLVGGLSLSLFGLLAVSALSVWSMTAMTIVALSKENMTASAAFLAAKHYYWSMALVGFLIYGITMVGLLLAIIPAIIFSIWFALAGCIVVAEKKGGIAALVASRRYVSGRWLAVAGRIIGVGFLVSIVFGIAVGIISTMSEAVGELFQLVGNLLFLTPLLVLLIAQVYTQLKSIKGEVEISVTSKQKWGYGVTATFGVFVVPAIFAMIGYLLLGMLMTGSFPDWLV
jgi:hypothetical protein